MLAHRPATSDHTGCRADRCVGLCPELRGYSTTHEAFVTLLVTDLADGLHFTQQMPFRIDTGTPVSIVPRQRLQGGFRPPLSGWSPTDIDAPRQYAIGGVGGGWLRGHRYRAALALQSLNGGEPLVFGTISLFVTDEGHTLEYGLLGLDALRKVIMVSDHEHISFWPAR